MGCNTRSREAATQYVSVILSGLTSSESSVVEEYIPPLQAWTYVRFSKLLTQLLIHFQPNGTHGIVLAYTPATNLSYSYMQQLAQQHGLTIAPHPGDFSHQYDVVAFDNSTVLCGYFDVNPYASTVGLLKKLIQSYNF